MKILPKNSICCSFPSQFEIEKLMKAMGRYPINAPRWFYLNDLRRCDKRFSKYEEYRASFYQELHADFRKLIQEHPSLFS